MHMYLSMLLREHTALVKMGGSVWLMYWGIPLQLLVDIRLYL